jgi:hypothetical protein
MADDDIPTPAKLAKQKLENWHRTEFLKYFDGKSTARSKFFPDDTWDQYIHILQGWKESSSWCFLPIHRDVQEAESKHTTEWKTTKASRICIGRNIQCRSVLCSNNDYGPREDMGKVHCWKEKVSVQGQLWSPVWLQEEESTLQQ